MYHKAQVMQINHKILAAVTNVYYYEINSELVEHHLELKGLH